MHWLPVRKTAEFDPLARAAGWDRAQHERFNWLAGKELEQLGYTPKRYPDKRWLWAAWTRALDLKQGWKTLVKRWRAAYRELTRKT